MRGQRGEIGGVVSDRDEPVVIDTVVRDHDFAPRIDECAQTIGGVRAHAHQHRCPVCRRPDHPAEEHDLAALVPLGMVEERQVVDRHHARDARSQRHRVVRAVPDVDIEAGGQ